MGGKRTKYTCEKCGCSNDTSRTRINENDMMKLLELREQHETKYKEYLIDKKTLRQMESWFTFNRDKYNEIEKKKSWWKRKTMSKVVKTPRSVKLIRGKTVTRKYEMTKEKPTNLMIVRECAVCNYCGHNQVVRTNLETIGLTWE